jgi:hypothetical protein
VSFVGKKDSFKRYYNYKLSKLALGVLVVTLSHEQQAENRGKIAHDMTLRHPY